MDYQRRKDKDESTWTTIEERRWTKNKRGHGIWVEERSQTTGGGEHMDN